MTPAQFDLTDFTLPGLVAIYRDHVFPIASHGKREKPIALRGVYPKQPAHYLTWVRCENAHLCEEPHLISTCCHLPVTTHHTEGHPTFHQCSYCLTATDTREVTDETLKTETLK